MACETAKKNEATQATTRRLEGYKVWLGAGSKNNHPSLTCAWEVRASTVEDGHFDEKMTAKTKLLAVGSFQSTSP
jgi:hypothetical protein